MAGIGTLIGSYRSKVGFRTTVQLLVTLAFCLYYAVSGVLYRSAWFGALATYYIALTGARLFLLLTAKSDDPKRELRLYRLCGAAIFLLTVGFGAIAYNALFRSAAPKYPQQFHIIYGIAAFTFFNVTSASIKLAKRKNRATLTLTAECALSFVAAVVSLFILQVALLAEFGDDPAFSRTMDIAVGSVTSLLILCISVGMIFHRPRPS